MIGIKIKMKKFEIIDISPDDGHYSRRERFIGQIGTVIEGSNFSNKLFVSCKFVFDDPSLNRYYDKRLSCVIFYRVLLREIDEFRFQVRRALKKSALRAHR